MKKVTVTGTVKKVFAQEVEHEANTDSIINIEEGKPFEGLFYGEYRDVDFKDGKPAKRCYYAEDSEGEKVLLPSNIQLTNKLTSLVKIKGAEALQLGVDVQITNFGLQSIDGVSHKVKVFKVLTTE